MFKAAILQSPTLQNRNTSQENAIILKKKRKISQFSHKFTCNQSQFIVILPMSIKKNEL